MLSIKCEKCGKELCVNERDELFCAHCGFYPQLDDVSEIGQYISFRRAFSNHIHSEYPNARAAEMEEYRVWLHADITSFTPKTYKNIVINYLFHTTIDGIDIYLTKSSILYRFPSDRISCLDSMIHNIQALQVPSSQNVNLNDYFPELLESHTLYDDSVLFVFRRPYGYFPLAMFDTLSQECSTLALTEMRMVCNILTYSGLAHHGITDESIFLNPFQHKVMLFGSWWNVTAIKDGNTDFSDMKHAIQSYS